MTLHWAVYLLVCAIIWAIDQAWMARRRRVQTPAKTSRGIARDITGKPFPDIRNQRDDGDETSVPEGLGVARPPCVHRATHSPTTPLAYLPDEEWQFWTDVIQGASR